MHHYGGLDTFGLVRTNRWRHADLRIVTDTPGSAKKLDAPICCQSDPAH